MFSIILWCSLLVWSTQDTLGECPPIIRRKEWDAVKPKHINYLRIPVDLVIIQHTVTQSCSNDKSCAEIVRDIQKTHIEQSFLWDVAYSFLVGGTGKLYEGRGWHRVGIHTPGYNNQSIGIAFIGNFNNQDPSPKALNAVQALIQCGVDQNQLSANHSVVVHSQVAYTESPGHKLASKVMSWLNWAKDVTEIKKRADTEVTPEGRGLKVEQSGINNGLIWTNPKQIDSFTNLRDAIGELIQSMSKAARATLGVTAALAASLNKNASFFFETITLQLKAFKDQIGTAFTAISGIPGVQKCTNPLKRQANTLYSDIESKITTCAYQRINEVNETVVNLGTLTSNAIDYTNTAVEITKNCTELHYGIESSTAPCLISITQQAKTASANYESQRKTALTSINTLLKALPAGLELCAKQHLLTAGQKTTKIASDITQCSTNVVPIFSGFGR